MLGPIIAFLMLTPAAIVVGLILELPPVKRWLDIVAQDLPMFRNY